MLEISPVGYVILSIILVAYLFIRIKKIKFSPKILIIIIDLLSLYFTLLIIYAPSFAGELTNIYIEQLNAYLIWLFSFIMLIFLNLIFLFLQKKKANETALIIFIAYLILLLHGIFSIFSSSLL
jgi:hypothetical protein